jgi:hypothetical protein
MRTTLELPDALVHDIILTELLSSIVHKKERKLAELLNYIKKYELLIDWQEIRNIQLMAKYIPLEIYRQRDFKKEKI